MQDLKVVATNRSRMEDSGKASPAMLRKGTVKWQGGDQPANKPKLNKKSGVGSPVAAGTEPRSKTIDRSTPDQEPYNPLFPRTHASAEREQNRVGGGLGPNRERQKNGRVLLKNVRQKLINRRNNPNQLQTTGNLMLPQKATSKELWQGLLHEQAGQDGVKLDVERLAELRAQREKEELIQLVEPILEQELHKVHPGIFDLLPLDYLKKMYDDHLKEQERKKLEREAERLARLQEAPSVVLTPNNNSPPGPRSPRESVLMASMKPQEDPVDDAMLNTSQLFPNLSQANDQMNQTTTVAARLGSMDEKALASTVNLSASILDEELKVERNRPPREFEIVDKIYQNQLGEVERLLLAESPAKLKKLNALVEERVLKGTTEPTGNKARFDGLDKDMQKFVLEESLERIDSVMEKVKREYYSSKAEVQNRTVLKVNNQVKAMDPAEAQREIYNGRFQLKFSASVPMNTQIEQYAGETIAFHLYKKRDFLTRLQRHQQGLDKEDDSYAVFMDVIENLTKEERAAAKETQQHQKRNMLKLLEMEREAKEAKKRAAAQSSTEQSAQRSQEGDEDKKIQNVAREKELAALQNSKKQTSMDIFTKDGYIDRKEQKLSHDEVRSLLLDTINRIKAHNENDKKVSKQRVKMKIQKMMRKTQKLTQETSGKFVQMFYAGLRGRINRRDGSQPPGMQTGDMFDDSIYEESVYHSKSAIGLMPDSPQQGRKYTSLVDKAQRSRTSMQGQQQPQYQRNANHSSVEAILNKQNEKHNMWTIDAPSVSGAPHMDTIYENQRDNLLQVPNTNTTQSVRSNQDQMSRSTAKLPKMGNPNETGTEAHLDAQTRLNTLASNYPMSRNQSQLNVGKNRTLKVPGRAQAAYQVDLDQNNSISFFQSSTTKARPANARYGPIKVSMSQDPKHFQTIRKLERAKENEKQGYRDALLYNKLVSSGINFNLGESVEDLVKIPENPVQLSALKKRKTMDSNYSELGSVGPGRDSLKLPDVKSLSRVVAAGATMKSSQGGKNMYGYDDPTKALEKMLGRTNNTNSSSLESPESPSRSNITRTWLMKLTAYAENVQKRTIRNLNKLEVQRESQAAINERIDTSIEMLKKLDDIESNMLQTIFEYNKVNAAESKAEEAVLVREHRSGGMDPSGAMGKHRTKAAKGRLANAMKNIKK